MRTEKLSSRIAGGEFFGGSELILRKLCAKKMTVENDGVKIIFDRIFRKSKPPRKMEFLKNEKFIRDPLRSFTFRRVGNFREIS